MRLASSFALSFLIILAACGGSDPEPAAPAIEETPERLLVYTVNYPLAYFAERLGGDAVEVVFPAPADEDPVFWSPDAEDIAAYQQADLVLLNGAGYAKWVERATLPSSKVVDTTARATDSLLELTGTVSHSHGPEGEHEHHGWAFTTWLDPTLALEQARAVADALEQQRPQAVAAIQANLTALGADLSALDARLAAAADAIGDEPLLFSHPVYQYFINRYSLNGHQVHWEPDVEPDGKMWSELEHIVHHDGAEWMLWEGEPLAATVAGLDDRRISSVVYSPSANVPTEGDWLTVMEANAVAFESIAGLPADHAD